ncbi:nitrate- and nitrite sensing domain-containing protein [Dactylosporangium sp. AC04546]|uniref:sensor histidine kinase n=1 Tax=Dactylosporangium sp. AC04546 TaxID=2862460 RepID=UPI001EE13A31|nr:nitrate- and nitrite sensing domain-containing protein [Dactylosporangium sp. AC04546]WVK82760.1 nitrate- and nitrite sensing domain-containing protein [Dactylosporangium sp. AC04546]
MKSSSWRIRTWSIRAKIITLLVPPLASLVVMWIFATSLTAGAAFELFNSQTYYELTGKPSESVIVELQRERKLSVVAIAAGRTEGSPAVSALTEQRAKSNEAIADFRSRAEDGDLQDALPETARGRLQEVLTALEQVEPSRTAVTLGQVDRAGAMEAYAAPIDAFYRWYNSLPGVSDAALTRNARTVIATSRARELFAREDALVNGAAAAGKFVKTESGDLIAAIGAKRTAYSDAVVELPEDARAQFWTPIVDSAPYKQVRDLENKLLAEARVNGPLPIDVTVWRDAYDKVVEQLRTLDLEFGAQISANAQPVAVGIITRLVAAAVLGLLAVAVSIALSIRIGRSLIRRLTGLRHDAQHLADVRLPELVGRLRHGEEVDVVLAAPPLEYGADEIGKLGNAFSAVQRTAVQSAAHEAQLRRGLNEVFLNIARRSQTLLHRQLALLDRMERRTTDPDELEDLFRVDHLATRMRRHAEDLVILAGAAPGRGWRNPVPMIDVIRGAVSEVEDYARVGFLALPEASLVGRAVADVIHLLAEVIENATSYSPPHTRVQISGQLVPNGYAIEIEDRGLGMAPEAIEEANQRLLHPPDFDPANSARLGLFVVALLAARHGVRVTLRHSPYGGVTAVVLVPPHLITGATAELTAPTAAEQQLAAAEEVLELDAADVVRPTLDDVGPAPQIDVVAEHVETVPPVPLPPRTADAQELTDDGLPRRRRQASIVPQLRERPEDERTVDGIPAAEFAATGVGGRSPEQTRDMMSSLQAGFTRGRRDAAQLDDEITLERDV